MDSAADAAVVYPNGIKMLLGKGVSAFFIKGKLVFRNGTGSLTRNSLDCPNLDSWVFDNFYIRE